MYIFLGVVSFCKLFCVVSGLFKSKRVKRESNVKNISLDFIINWLVELVLMVLGSIE